MKPPLLPGAGDALVCLGMNPGYEEDLAGVPFVGRSGKKLREGYLPAIEKKLPGLAIYLTNAARCRADKVPTKVLKTCFPLHTIPDLRLIRERTPGRVVLWCLGASAVEAMSRCLLDHGRKGRPPVLTLSAMFKKHPLLPPDTPRPPDHGWPMHEYVIDGRPSATASSWTYRFSPLVDAICATYHPAAVLRDGGLQNSVARHINLLYLVLTDNLPSAINPDLVEPFPCQ